MKINVRLFATLRDGRGKLLDLEVREGSTVLDVLEMLKINQDEIAILLVNGRDGGVDVQLVDGDNLSLFPPVGGG